MNAELKHLHSPDVQNLATFEPEIGDHFAILVQAMIGPAGTKESESFSLIVCTAAWLADHAADLEGPEWGRGFLIVKRFVYRQVVEAVENLCSRTTGTTWQAVALDLNRFMLWEFDDYSTQPTSPGDGRGETRDADRARDGSGLA